MMMAPLFVGVARGAQREHRRGEKCTKAFWPETGQKAARLSARANVGGRNRANSDGGVGAPNC